MDCKDIMLTPICRCAPDTTAAECAQMMRDEGLGFVPVLDAKGAVVGVVTDRDLAVRVLAERLPPTTPVASIMTPGPFLACHPDESVRSLEERMAQTRRARALVQEPNGTLVGVISLTDVAHAETSATRTGQLMRAVTSRQHKHPRH